MPLPSAFILTWILYYVNSYRPIVIIAAIVNAIITVTSIIKLR